MLLLFRGLAFPLFDRTGKEVAPEMDESFERDVQERGADASAPVGPGGKAARESVVNRS